MAFEKLIVLDFCDDGSFWGLLEFQELSEVNRIMSHVDKVKVRGDQVNVEDMCLITSHLNGEDKWVRAKVCHILSSRECLKLELFLVDYGILDVQPIERIFKLPDVLSEYAPLAKKYYMKDVQPCAKNSHPWRVEVKRTLESVCHYSGLLVEADIAENYLATIYVENSESKEFINFNSLLHDLKLAEFPTLLPTTYALYEDLGEKSGDSSSMTTVTTSDCRNEVSSAKDILKSPVVFVETSKQLSPVTLETSGIPLSFISELRNMGMTSLTGLQSHAIPYVQSTKSIVMISPTASGKTLSYLLPVMGNLTPDYGFTKPRFFILTASSIQAESIKLQVQKMVSWMVDKRIRVVCAYYANEIEIGKCHGIVLKGVILSEIDSSSDPIKFVYFVTVYSKKFAKAYYCLLNGADVLIATPSTALRLLEKEPALFCNLSYMIPLPILEIINASDLENILEGKLQRRTHVGFIDDTLAKVLDDYNLAYNTFFKEWNDLSKILDFRKYQVIAAGRTWSEGATMVKNMMVDPVVIMSCSIEVAIKYNVSLNISPVSESVMVSLLSNIKSKINVLICTSTDEEASYVHQMLQMYNIFPGLLTKTDMGNSVNDISKVTILSDELLMSSSGSNLHCTTLLHFSPPKNKSTFRLRLSCFYSSMHKNMQCTCTVIGTAQWPKQSIFLEDMISRLGMAPVPCISTMAATEIENRERNKIKRNHDYCYDLKAWGQCRRNDCQSLHQPRSQFKHIFDSSEPYVLNSLSNGYVKVKISHVSNASRIWVSLLNQTFTGDDNLSCDIQYKKLSFELSEYYSIPENRTFQANPQEGSYCGYQTEDGLFFRVQVLKFSRPLGFYFPHKEHANIRLIDIGNMETVEVTQLLVLPKKFMALPPQVMEAYICNIKPKDGDQDWPLEVVKCGRKLMEGKILECHIAHFFNRILWLDQVEYKKVLTGINISTTLYKVSSEFIKYEMAERNLGHLDNIKKKFHCQNSDYSFNMKKLSVGTRVNVLVTAVDSLSLFYIQLSQNQHRISKIEEELNADNKKTSSPVFKIGDLCSAQFPHDSRWYRGKVIATSPNMLEIYFGDYGDTAWLNSDLVKSISSSLSKLPFQAVECSLDLKNVDVKDGNIFWDLTRNNIYYMNIFSVGKSNVDECALSYSVTLTNVNTGVDITKTLMEYLHAATSKTSEEKRAVTKTESPLKELFKNLTVSNVDLGETLEEIQYMVMNNFSLTVTRDEMDKLANFLSQVSNQVSISTFILRILNGLVVIHGLSCSPSSFKYMIQGLKTEESFVVHALNTTAYVERCVVFSEEACLHYQCCSADVVDLTLLFIKLSFIKEGLNDLSFIAHSLCDSLKTWKFNRMIMESILEFIVLFDEDRSIKKYFFQESLSLVLESTLSQSCKDYLLEFLCVCATGTEITKVLFLLDVNSRKSLTKQMIFNVLQNIEHVQDFSCMLAQNEDPLLRFMLKDPVSESVHSNMRKTSTIHSSTTTVCCPKVLWSQDKSHITLAVQLCGCTDVKVQTDGKIFWFRALVFTTKYEFTLALFDHVSASDIKVKYLMSEVLVKLNKIKVEIWSRPTESLYKTSFIHYDMARLTDSDNSSLFKLSGNLEHTRLCAEDILYDMSQLSDSVSSEDESNDDFEDMQFLCDDV